MFNIIFCCIHKCNRYDLQTSIIDEYLTSSCIDLTQQKYITLIIICAYR